MRRLALASLFFALACVIAYVSLQEGWLRFNYPSMQRYPIRGIDVSHHQGEVDWTAVRDDGGSIVDQQLWARDVFRSPRWLGRQAWTFWQYGNRGRVAGISGPVDLNVFHGDHQAWSRFRAPPS